MQEENNEEKFVPKHVILELDTELPAFEQVMLGWNMPTFDRDACFQQIFEVVLIFMHDELFNKKLAELASEMGNGDTLFSNAYFTDEERDQIVIAVIRVGKNVRERMVKLNADIDGIFPYVFKTLFGRCGVVLTLSENLYGNMKDYGIE